MSFTSRESVLSWIVGILILLSLSYWFGAPKARIWKETVENQKQLADRIALAERLIQQQGEWTLRLDALKTKLSKYDAGKDVTADYLKILERVAKDTSVNLVQRRPQKEKQHGDLYELAIDCTWEGNLEGLVRFLYALEQENVTMDVEDITVSLVSGGKGQMKGNFTLMCIYSRSGEPAPEEKAAIPKRGKS
ncbi:MAG: hypothetical protein KKG09_07505 [Verrucomicrobia bacterium]|nr:hypothetical protein [Verrucomicrobiota bacterium]MCG2679293.1 GspMb/PilO family protein [Kiritimatiellia bacterium]MBU4247330.1 hypothetical protein [Verrucomicrobiota bacterium]MBU4292270.1 hypothetical protein [Verrucomicrobiota bacterium]MBU4428290.1 hypothetical protein [Verrucomicrobiota bacterium]